MGNYYSKFFTHQEQNTELKVQQSVQPTIVEKHDENTTPIAKRTLPIDPRSISTGIFRTPIEITRTPPVLTKRVVNALPKHLKEKLYLETNVDVILPPLSPKKCIDSKPTNTNHTESPIFMETVPDCTSPTVNIVQTPAVLIEQSNGDTPIEELRYKILGLDPRSPAVDFDRTPILKPKSLSRLKARSQENLARRGSYTNDIYNPRLSYCETTTSNSIPEIQVLPDIIVNLNKASSLENCTTSTLDKSDSSSSDDNSSTESTSDSSENITVIHNTNVKLSADFESIVSSIASSKKMTNLNAKVMEPEIIPEKTLIEIAEDNDKKEDLVTAKQASEQQLELAEDGNKVQVWKDLKLPKISLIPDLDASETLVLLEEIETSTPKEEIIIEFDDNVMFENIKYTSTQKTVKMQDTKLSKQGLSIHKKKNIKIDNRIIMDEKKLYTADWKNTVPVAKNRAPLGNRSNNSQVQGTIKSPQQLLRNKTHASKIQQENTPPHKKDIVKSKLNIQWDPDSTVLI